MSIGIRLNVVVVDNAAAHSSAAKAPEAHGSKHLSGTLVAGLKNETTYLSKMLQRYRAAPAQSLSDPGFRQGWSFIRIRRALPSHVLEKSLTVTPRTFFHLEARNFAGKTRTDKRANQHPDSEGVLAMRQVTSRFCHPFVIRVTLQIVNLMPFRFQIFTPPKTPPGFPQQMPSPVNQRNESTIGRVQGEMFPKPLMVPFPRSYHRPAQTLQKPANAIGRPLTDFPVL